MKILNVDLTDKRIKGYVNRGYGIIDYGVSHSESGLLFENEYTDLNAFPMFAVDFSEYLASENVNIDEVDTIEMTAIIYDEAGNEIDLSSEFQKCAFVSAGALDGYSASDILPSGNYKEIGSKVVTTFDLTKYTGYTSDGQNLTKSALADGVGFNIQIVNGEHSRLRFLLISSLKFIYNKDKFSIFD